MKETGGHLLFGNVKKVFSVLNARLRDNNWNVAHQSIQVIELLNVVNLSNDTSWFLVAQTLPDPPVGRHGAGAAAGPQLLVAVRPSSSSRVLAVVAGDARAAGAVACGGAPFRLPGCRKLEVRRLKAAGAVERLRGK